MYIRFYYILISISFFQVKLFNRPKLHPILVFEEDTTDLGDSFIFFLVYNFNIIENFIKKNKTKKFDLTTLDSEELVSLVYELDECESYVTHSSFFNNFL